MQTPDLCFHSGPASPPHCALLKGPIWWNLINHFCFKDGKCHFQGYLLRCLCSPFTHLSPCRSRQACNPGASAGVQAVCSHLSSLPGLAWGPLDAGACRLAAGHQSSALWSDHLIGSLLLEGVIKLTKGHRNSQELNPPPPPPLFFLTI